MCIRVEGSQVVVVTATSAFCHSVTVQQPFRDFRDGNDSVVHAVKYIETVQKKVLKDSGYSELEKKEIKFFTNG
jgi:hypothetical protein